MKNTLQNINFKAETDALDFISKCENDYKNEIDNLSAIISEKKGIKIISIAGPSASGKTTSAHILCEDLAGKGIKTKVISLDNFYLPIDELPLLEDGTKDIESVNALDLKLLSKCFSEIITKGKTILPEFDFQKKIRILESQELEVTDGGIVITEGLHALNPVITDLVPMENIFKIYISINCPVMDEDGKRLLSSRQLRLVRRALRDEVFRGTPINETLKLWNGVIEGEEKYLYCFKDTADILLKTLHLFEPCVYRDRFVKMENEIKADSPYYEYFLKTAKVLEKFIPLQGDLVPYDSLIREFLGKGKYS